MKEFLKALNLEEKVISDILTELGSNYIPRERYNELNKKYQEIKTDSENVTKLNEEIATLKSTIENKEKEYKERINSMELDKLLNLEILSHKPKSTELLLKIVDKGKLSIKDGKLEGLNEQMDTIKETYKYLFEENNTTNGFVPETPESKKETSTTLLGAIGNYYNK